MAIKLKVKEYEFDTVEELRKFEGKISEKPTMRDFEKVQKELAVEDSIKPDDDFTPSESFRWSQQEDDLLIKTINHVLENSKSISTEIYIRLANLLKRSQQAVKSRVQHLKSEGHIKSRFLEKKEPTLKELEAEQKEIMEDLLMEEKPKEDTRKIRFDYSKPSFRKKWKKKDDKNLRKMAKELAEQGKSLQEALDTISSELSRSKASIISRLSFIRIRYVSLLKKKTLEQGKEYRPHKSIQKKSWSRDEELTFARFINKDLRTNKRAKTETYILLSKKLGRTIFALKKRAEILRSQGLIGKDKTVLVSKKKEPSLKKLELVGKPKFKWSQAEDNFLIAEINKELKNRQMVREKTYKRLSRKMKKKHTAIQSRVYHLKHEGLINRKSSPELRKLRFDNMMKGKLKKQQVRVIPKEPSAKKPKKRFREVWTDAEDRHLISVVKKELQNRKKIRKRTYYNLANHFNRKLSAIKTRVYLHKTKGLLPKLMSPEVREKMTRKMREKRKQIIEKKKDDDKGYMKSKKPTVPIGDRLRGKIKEFIPIFSRTINPDQNELLKSMILNDIKNAGASKITFDKLSYIMSIDEDSYETLLADIVDNTKRIKNNLEIGVVSLQKQANENFIVFS